MKNLPMVNARWKAWSWTHATLVAFAFFSMAFVPAGTALSQSVVIPPSTDSGQMERRFEAPTEPRATHDPVFRSGSQPPPDPTGEMTLTLHSVAVEGSTVYAAEDLAPLWEQSLGKVITLAEVFRIADAITAKYRNDGYVLSRAVVPPQTITDGAIRIQVVEGYIDEVRIEREVHGQSPLLDAYAAQIRHSRPLSIAVLERYLLLFGDLPGITPKAVISPAKDTPGAANLVILVEDDEADGFVRIGNRGSRFNGPRQLWLGGGLNSMTGVHDRTTVRLVTTERDELTYLEAGYERQIGTEGRKLYLRLTETDSQPGHTLRELELESKSLSFTVGVAHPWVRSRARNVTLYADFVVRDSQTKTFDETLSKDRIRSVSVGARYDSADRFGGVNQLAAGLDQGLGGMLGASKDGSTDLSREKGRADFTKLRFSASRLQQLGHRWSVFAGFNSQFSLSKLLASEEFGVGGEHCGRGYNPSQVTGDTGACLQVEMRYGHNLGARALAGYQLYGFYDVGGVWRKHPGALEKKADLSSAGFGARLNFNEWLSGSLEAAWPLTDEADSQRVDTDSKHGYFTLNARF